MPLDDEAKLTLSSLRMIIEQRGTENDLRSSVKVHLDMLEQKIIRMYAKLMRQGRQQAPMSKNFTETMKKLEMWANAQRDGRPAEYRWRPLFNAAKFG